ncbi:protein of unknown function [Paraburkholderia dioscoreae]|uniref:Uncharacterized protein n=1 Tax=Paraburkholderia dioscoreae TaxID=2604047 RepID=A0A5Q4Z289_9BURK|nr:protein of unknown function [Paraburkholderia dioscoreae]
MFIDSLLKRVATDSTEMLFADSFACFVERQDESFDYKPSHSNYVLHFPLCLNIRTPIGFGLLHRFKVSLDKDDSERTKNCKHGGYRLCQRKVVAVVPRHG